MTDRKPYAAPELKDWQPPTVNDCKPQPCPGCGLLVRYNEDRHELTHDEPRCEWAAVLGIPEPPRDTEPPAEAHDTEPPPTMPEPHT